MIKRSGCLWLSALALLLVVVGGCMSRMPGKSYSQPLPSLSPGEELLRDALRRDVEKLAGEIGARNSSNYKALRAAESYLAQEFGTAGFKVNRQEYEIDSNTYANLEVEIKGSGRPDEIVIVGSHYDTCFEAPGANDNASGVAAVLALARAFSGKQPQRTLRFVAFVNEEPPWFWSRQMGSLQYARGCKARHEKIVGMLTLETIGYYSEEAHSQHYPPVVGWLYPSRGNFIAFIGNLSSARLVRKVVGAFRVRAKFPSEGAALPGWTPGIGLSDHWSFWHEGYPALMVTDTAPYRYPFYHTAGDTPEKLDYERMARVVNGLEQVIAELVK